MTPDPRLTSLADKVRELSERIETADAAIRLTDQLYTQATAATAHANRLELQVRELTRQLASAEGSDAMRAEYRRGYGAGFHAGRRNGERDADQVKRRRRPPSTIVPVLDEQDWAPPK